MKFAFLLITMLVTAVPALAQSNDFSPPPDGKYPTVVIEAGLKVTSGPVGFGWLRLGTPLEKFVAGAELDGVRLETNLSTPPRVPPTLGPTEKYFFAQLTTPFSKEPLNTYLTFRSGRLTGFNLQFGSGVAGFETATAFRNRVTEKYGSAVKMIPGAKEKECVYRNGAVIKILDGTNVFAWYHSVDDMRFIETAFYDRASGTCAENLTKDQFRGYTSSSLVIRYVETDPITAKNRERAF